MFPPMSPMPSSPTTKSPSVGSTQGLGTALSLLDGLVAELREERQVRGMSPLSQGLRRLVPRFSQSGPGPSSPINVGVLTENTTLRRTQAHHLMSIERMVEEGAEIALGSDGEELRPEDSISERAQEREEVTVRRTGLSTYRRTSGAGGDLVWLELTPTERREISDRELKAGRTDAFELDSFFD